jgi:hypothetical protein
LSIHSKRIKTILKILLCVFIGALILDYILAEGGYRAFLAHLHPTFFHLRILSVLLVALWVALGCLDAVIHRKWPRFLLWIMIGTSVFVGSKIAINVLAEKSQKRATDLVARFVSDEHEFFKVKIESNVQESYHSFMQQGDRSLVKLKYSSPPFGRYDFVVTPRESGPFTLTFWMENGGGKIWIHE